MLVLVGLEPLLLGEGMLRLLLGPLGELGPQELGLKMKMSMGLLWVRGPWGLGLMTLVWAVGLCVLGPMSLMLVGQGLLEGGLGSRDGPSGGHGGGDDAGGWSGGGSGSS